MGKTRKSNKHLPRRMYLNHNIYFYVSKDNKWINLGREYPLALAKWAEIEGGIESDGTLNTAIAKYEIEELPLLAKSTQQTNAFHIAKLKAVFGEMLLSDIKPFHVKQYLSSRKKKSSANREIAVLSAIMSCAMGWGWCDINPCIGIKRNKEKARDRYISDEEINLLKSYADDTYKCLIDLSYLTAARIGDLLDIKLKDIKDDHLLIIQNKTGRKQQFTWNKDLKDVIEAAKKARKTRNFEYLFTNTKAQKITQTGYNSAIKRLIIKTGLENIHFHDIRAKALTDAKKAKGLDYAQLLGGHANQSQTESYIKSKEFDIVQPLNKFY